MQRFELRAWGWNYGGATLDMACTRCKWTWEQDQADEDNETATLAELVQRAEEHAEVCR
jgi:hypothetical protein